jgi:iron donor protein CyaY
MTSFSQTYDTTIRDLEQKLAAMIDAGSDFDFTRSGDVLTIEFEDGEKIVITPQSPMEQLWISANYAGHRFNWSEEHNDWIHEKTGELFEEFVVNALSKKLG